MWIEGRSKDVPRPLLWKERCPYPKGSGTYVWVVFRHICLVERPSSGGKRIQRGAWDVPLRAVFGRDSQSVGKAANKVLDDLKNAFEVKELSREDVHSKFVNDESRLLWPDECDAESDGVRNAFVERRRLSDLHKPFGKRVSTFERALSSPLKLDLLEAAFDQMLDSCHKSEEWSAKRAAMLGSKLPSTYSKGVLDLRARGRSQQARRLSKPPAEGKSLPFLPCLLRQRRC